MDKKWIFLNFRASEIFFEMHQDIVKFCATKTLLELQNDRVRINVPPSGSFFLPVAIWEPTKMTMLLCIY